MRNISCTTDHAIIEWQVEKIRVHNKDSATFGLYNDVTHFIHLSSS